MDRFASSAALLLFLSILLMVAAIIKLASKGPVLFMPERSGQSGHTLDGLQLRTMHVDNDPAFTANL
jgi:lipopolysaccharide/colanic/teichoic acid biosynthesis glycosyltransferase